MRGRLALALALILAACSGACVTYVPEDRTDRRERHLVIESHEGGSHHRTMVAGDRWYQTFSNQVLVLDTKTGRVLGSVDVVPFGEGGAVVDMVVDGDTLWVVSDYTLVAAIDVHTPARPEVVERITAEELGLEPRRVTLAGGEIWVTGEGGAVRLRDRRRFLTGEPVARVVQTPQGPVATVRRRILTVEDGRYLGAATELQPLPPGFGPDGGYLFVLQGPGSAQVGLMTPGFIETTVVAVPGWLRRARVVGDRLFLVTETALEAWELEGGKLVRPLHIRLKGGRDLDLIRPNIYAVSGTFGRAMYRLDREGGEEGDTFFNVQREPGLLELAILSRPRVLAGGREGFWLWRPGQAPVLSDRVVDVTTIPARTVEATWGTATMVMEDGGGEFASKVALKLPGGTLDYVPDEGSRVSALALVEGDLWVGHERGLDILRKRAGGASPELIPDSVAAEFQVLHQFRFEGPVLFIFPENIGGAASVVSLHGGFVFLRPVPVGPAPVFEGRGTFR